MLVRAYYFRNFCRFVDALSSISEVDECFLHVGSQAIVAQSAPQVGEQGSVCLSEDRSVPSDYANEQKAYP